MKPARVRMLQGAHLKCYKGSMKRVFYFLFTLGSLSFGALNLGAALEMTPDSEQFYVAQGLFADLGIEAVPCGLEDPTINFACGQYAGELPAFQEGVNSYVQGELPGLFLALAWFKSGETTVQDYRSAGGRYLIGFNPGGFVVIAFTPR